MVHLDNRNSDIRKGTHTIEQEMVIIDHSNTDLHKPMEKGITNIANHSSIFDEADIDNT